MAQPDCWGLLAAVSRLLFGPSEQRLGEHRQQASEEGSLLPVLGPVDELLLTGAWKL